MMHFDWTAIGVNMVFDAVFFAAGWLVSRWQTNSMWKS